jgi:predicted alpha/beta-hydrolase family hydrolase
MPTNRLDVDTPTGTGWIDLDRPTGPARAVLALGHGAGGGVTTPDVLAVTAAALAAGFAVARITQPYRVAGRRSPAPAPRLDEAWISMIAALRRARGLASVPLVQGGRSSGARVACRTAAATGARAVVALAFPLHPPGDPSRSRIDELTLPDVPVLVVQGDRDAFGMPPAEAADRLVVIPGADHGLKKATAVIADAVVDFVEDVLAS